MTRGFAVAKGRNRQSSPCGRSPRHPAEAGQLYLVLRSKMALDGLTLGRCCAIIDAMRPAPDHRDQEPFSPKPAAQPPPEGCHHMSRQRTKPRTRTMHISLPEDVIAQVNERLFDPSRGKPLYGGYSMLTTALLRRWLEDATIIDLELIEEPVE